MEISQVSHFLFLSKPFPLFVLSTKRVRIEDDGNRQECKITDLTDCTYRRLARAARHSATLTLAAAAFRPMLFLRDPSLERATP